MDPFTYFCKNTDHTPEPQFGSGYEIPTTIKFGDRDDIRKLIDDLPNMGAEVIAANDNLALKTAICNNCAEIVQAIATKENIKLVLSDCLPILAERNMIRMTELLLKYSDMKMVNVLNGLDMFGKNVPDQFFEFIFVHLDDANKSNFLVSCVDHKRVDLIEKLIDNDNDMFIFMLTDIVYADDLETFKKFVNAETIDKLGCIEMITQFAIDTGKVHFIRYLMSINVKINLERIIPSIIENVPYYCMEEMIDLVIESVATIDEINEFLNGFKTDYLEQHKRVLDIVKKKMDNDHQ